MRKEHFYLNHDNFTPEKCKCGGEFKKVMSNSSFILKGSGWYSTDYAKKDSKNESSSSKSFKEPLKKKEVSNAA